MVFWWRYTPAQMMGHIQQPYAVVSADRKLQDAMINYGGPGGLPAAV